MEKENLDKDPGLCPTCGHDKFATLANQKEIFIFNKTTGWNPIKSEFITDNKQISCHQCHTPIDYNKSMTNHRITVKTNNSVTISFSNHEITIENNKLISAHRHKDKEIDTIESIVLAHHMAGIDITTTQYLDGLNAAVDAITNSL